MMLAANLIGELLLYVAVFVTIAPMLKALRHPALWFGGGLALLATAILLIRI